MKKYRENELIEIYNPSAKLDLIHVDDVMNVLSKSFSIPCDTYNLCSGYAVTVAQVYQDISNFLKIDKPTKIVSDNEDCSGNGRARPQRNRSRPRGSG